MPPFFSVNSDAQHRTPYGSDQQQGRRYGEARYCPVLSARPDQDWLIRVRQCKNST